MKIMGVSNLVIEKPLEGMIGEIRGTSRLTLYFHYAAGSAVRGSRYTCCRTDFCKNNHDYDANNLMHV